MLNRLMSVVCLFTSSDMRTQVTRRIKTARPATLLLSTVMGCAGPSPSILNIILRIRRNPLHQRHHGGQRGDGGQQRGQFGAGRSGNVEFERPRRPETAKERGPQNAAQGLPAAHHEDEVGQHDHADWKGQEARRRC